MRGEVRAGGRHEGVGRRRRKRHARGGPDSKGWGQKARAERTWNICCMYVTLDVSKLSGWLNTAALRNIRYMFVTLDVSKLSGWLKAAASYRVEREACTRDAGRSVRAGRLDIGRGAGASGMCTGRARLKAGAQGTRVAHPEHPAHVRDLGRVEAQRLVERRSALPSRKEGMRCGARCGPREREGMGWRRPKRRAWRGPDSRLGARARAERTLNM